MDHPSKFNINMAIYVDTLFMGKQFHGYHGWCHLATDGNIAELHRFATGLGLKIEWFQNIDGHPHYDITTSKRALAITNGALSVSCTELWKRCFDRRKYG